MGQSARDLSAAADKATAADVIGDMPTPFFADLKAALIEILEEVAGEMDSSEGPKNRFTLEVLGLIQFMIRQGYFDPRCGEIGRVEDGVLLFGDDLKRIVPSLVKIMDGRDDIGFVDHKHRETIDMLQLEALLRPGSASRFELNHENQIVMRLKYATLNIMNDLFGIHASTRVNFVLEELANILDKQADMTKESLSGAEEEGAFDQMNNPLRVNPASAGMSFEVESFEVEDGSPNRATAAANSVSLPPAMANGESAAEALDPKQLVSAMHTARHVLKADQSQRKSSFLFVNKADNELLPEVLLDGMRYVEDTALVLSSFSALYNFRAQNARFHGLLKEVTLLSTTPEATLFIATNQIVTTYAKSVQRLLEEQYARHCIVLTDKMSRYCTTGGPEKSAKARALLRHCEVDKHIAVMLETHPNDVHEESFSELLHSTLGLAGALCSHDDEESQVLLTGYMESTFLPLFGGGPTIGDPEPTRSQRLEIMLETAVTLPKLFSGNRELAISYASILVIKVVDQIRVFGKHVELLNVLLPLVQVNGKSVEFAQGQVSKGLIEKSGRNLDCALSENEWGDGPAMEQRLVLINAMKDDKLTQRSTTLQPTRAQLELDYYCKLITLMGLCARGLMPHTELQAASMLSFDRLMIRLVRLFMMPELGGYQYALERMTRVKKASMLFLNDVFIDSDSEFVQTIVQDRFNGLFTVPPKEVHYRKPLCTLLCDDIRSLNARSTDVFREYIMTEVCDFFILYCVSGTQQPTGKVTAVSAVGKTMAEEAEAIKAAMMVASQVADEALTASSATRCQLRPDEIIILEHLRDTTKQWASGEELPLQAIESLRRAGADIPDRIHMPQPETLIQKTWDVFVQQFAIVNGVELTDGKSDDVSTNMLRVARDIVTEIDDVNSAESRYSAVLLKALEAWVEVMVHSTTAVEMPAKEVTTICSLLNIMRAVPFTVYGDEKRMPEKDILAKYLAQDVAIFTNPSVALSESQIEIVREGWGLLCWKILSVANLHGLHLAAVRLLSTVLGGGNYDVQTQLLEDLTNKNKCSRELLGASCRRIFTSAAHEFRLIRKKKHSSSDGDIFNVTAHILNILCSCCEFLHKGFQDYIPSQSGHEETFMLIPDIYELMVEMEREMQRTVEYAEQRHSKLKKSRSQLEDQAHGEEISEDLPVVFGAFSKFSLIDMFESGFRLLINLISGPHVQNSSIVSSSGVLMVAARVIKYANITRIEDIQDLPKDDPSPSRFEDPWALDPLIKCRLSCYVTELVLALLEGTPDRQVVMTVIQALDFPVWSSHMRTLKSILGGRAEFGSIPAATARCAWVNAQSFSMCTIIERLVSFGLPRSAMMPLMAVLKQKPLLDFFKSRTGQVLAVRHGKLETLYFDKSLLPNDMTDPTSVASLALASQVEIFLDVAYDAAGEDDSRLSVFFELVMEHIWTIDRNIQTLGKSDATRDNLIVNGVQILSKLTSAWLLMFISLGINLILLLSLSVGDEEAGLASAMVSSESSDMSVASKFKDLGSMVGPIEQSFERWQPGASLLNKLCPFHLLSSFIALMHFICVMNPIVAKSEARKKMLRKLRQKNEKDSATTFKDFISCTIHVKDLPRNMAEVQLREILAVYGDIQQVHISKISWKKTEALVSFLQEDSVDRVAEHRVEAPASLWEERTSIGLRSLAKVGKGTVLNLSIRKSKSKNQEPQIIRRVLNAQKISLEQAKRSTGGFSEMLHAAARKYTEGDDQQGGVVDQAKLAFANGTNVASRVEGVLGAVARVLNGGDEGFVEDKAGFVAETSKESLFSFKLGKPMLYILVDLLFSLLGYYVHNLWFSYHLLHVFRVQAAKIVLKSVTQNASRLGLTLLLALLLMYMMAIIGYTTFREFHRGATGTYVDEDDNPTGGRATGNEGGACSTLLTCFVAYSFSGFLQQGLTYWMEAPTFPEGPIGDDFWYDNENGFLGPVFNGQGLRLLFEMSFMLIMSGIVVAIITGIIVDTFSELRAGQENAKAYRKTTCFITGVNFQNVPEKKSTQYMEYVYLIVFLRRKQARGQRPLTPLEQFVASRLDQGDISWVPSLGTIADIEEDESATTGSSGLTKSSSTHSTADIRLERIERQLSNVVDMLGQGSAGPAEESGGVRVESGGEQLSEAQLRNGGEISVLTSAAAAGEDAHHGDAGD